MPKLPSHKKLQQTPLQTPRQDQTYKVALERLGRAKDDVGERHTKPLPRSAVEKVRYEGELTEEGEEIGSNVPKKKARYRGLRRMKEAHGIRLLEKMVEKMSLNEGISVNLPGIKFNYTSNRAARSRQILENCSDQGFVQGGLGIGIMLTPQFPGHPPGR